MNQTLRFANCQGTHMAVPRGIQWATGGGWKRHNWPKYTIYFFLFPLSCSSLPTPSHFYSSLLVLKSYGCAVNLPSPLCLSRYKVQFMLAACRKITSNPWSKVLLTLSIITLTGFGFVSLVRSVLRVYCKEALLKVFCFQSWCTLGCTNAHLQ